MTLFYLIQSVLVPVIVAVISSVVVTSWRMKQQRDWYYEKNIKQWERDCKRELHAARRKLIDTKNIIPEDTELGPDRFVEETDFSRLDIFDDHVRAIEKLTSESPEKYSGTNLTHHMEEITRLYRTEPDHSVGQSHTECWKNLDKTIGKALKELKES